jgi:hypothetical protein
MKIKINFKKSHDIFQKIFFKSQNSCGTTKKDPSYQKEPSEVTHYVISKYTTSIWQSKHHGKSLKTNTWINISE